MAPGSPGTELQPLLCLSPALNPTPARGCSDAQRQHPGSEPALSGLAAIATASQGSGKGGWVVTLHPGWAAPVERDPAFLPAIKGCALVLGVGPGPWDLPASVSWGTTGVTPQLCVQSCCAICSIRRSVSSDCSCSKLSSDRPSWSSCRDRGKDRVSVSLHTSRRSRVPCG